MCSHNNKNREKKNEKKRKCITSRPHQNPICKLIHPQRELARAHNAHNVDDEQSTLSYCQKMQITHIYMPRSFFPLSFFFFFFSFVYFSEEQFECHKLSSALPSTHHTVIPQFIALLSFIFFLLACRMHADTEYASFNVHLLLGRWGLIHQTPRRSGMQYFFFQKCCSVLSAVCLK